MDLLVTSARLPAAVAVVRRPCSGGPWSDGLPAVTSDPSTQQPGQAGTTSTDGAPHDADEAAHINQRLIAFVRFDNSAQYTVIWKKNASISVRRKLFSTK